MIKHPLALYLDIETDEDLNKFIDRDFGICVLNVFSEWCGPCISMDTLLVRYKVGQFGDRLWLANCNSDTINELSRFNRTSEPIWLFVRNGKAVNLFVGCESKEFFDVLNAEMKYESLGIRRAHYNIDELLPVEVETRTLIAEVNLQKWVMRMKKPLMRLNRCINTIMSAMPKVRFTVLGPHLRMNVVKDLIERAEKYNIYIMDRRVVKLRSVDFNIINFACTNPLEMSVMKEYIDRYVCVCMWRLPESCKTRQEMNQLMDTFIKEANITRKWVDGKTVNVDPLVPNVHMQHPLSQFEQVNPSDCIDKYAELKVKYGPCLSSLFAAMPGLVLNDYNEHCLLEVIFNAHDGRDPHVRPDKYEYQEYRDFLDESEVFVAMRDQKTHFDDLNLYGPDPLTLEEVRSHTSELFGEQGIDDDLVHLLSYLGDDDDLAVEESEADIARNLPVMHDTDVLQLLVKTVPGIWMPDTARGNATLLYLFFETYVKGRLPPVKPPRHKQLVMTFKAKYLDSSVTNAVERNRSNILNIGFFTSNDPYAAKFIADTYPKYQQFNEDDDDCLVLALDVENSMTAINFAKLGPNYVSPNVVEGADDAKLFFKHHPHSFMDETDLLNQTERLQQLYGTWRETAQRSYKEPSKSVARDYYSVPLYKELIRKRFTKPIEYSKLWYTVKLHNYLGTRGMKEALHTQEEVNASNTGSRYISHRPSFTGSYSYTTSMGSMHNVKKQSHRPSRPSSQLQLSTPSTYHMATPSTYQLATPSTYQLSSAQPSKHRLFGSSQLSKQLSKYQLPTSKHPSKEQVSTVPSKEQYIGAHLSKEQFAGSTHHLSTLLQQGSATSMLQGSTHHSIKYSSRHGSAHPSTRTSISFSEAMSTRSSSTIVGSIIKPEARTLKQGKAEKIIETLIETVDLNMELDEPAQEQTEQTEQSEQTEQPAEPAEAAEQEVVAAEVDIVTYVSPVDSVVAVDPYPFKTSVWEKKQSSSPKTRSPRHSEQDSARDSIKSNVSNKSEKKKSILKDNVTHKIYSTKSSPAHKIHSPNPTEKDESKKFIQIVDRVKLTKSAFSLKSASSSHA